MTYRELYERGKQILSEAGVPEADLDARLLLEAVCGTKRHDLLAHGEREVEAAQEDKYVAFLAKRAKRIPLQQIIGEQEFMGLAFAVTKDVLIPRQDTEILTEEAMRYLHDGMRILDMCTGSGCILISLLHYSNDCTGVGADISEAALQAAKQNAKRLLGEKQEQIAFVQSDLFEKIEGQFHIIVSNPPYIETNVIETLMPEVREHEPRIALDGGDDGLWFYRRIISESRKHFTQEGMLFLEIGYSQAEQVSSLMQEAGFLEVQTVKDFAGNDRVVFGTYIK